MGPYCAICGQEQNTHRRSVTGLAHDFVTDIVNFDSRIMRTAKALLLEPGELTRAFREGHTLVATLRGINFNPGAQPEDMVSLQLWCDGDRLITLRHLKLQTPRDVLAELDAGSGPKDAGAMVTTLIEHLVSKMNSAIVDMNDEIDKLESLEPVEADPDGMLVKISTIRRSCLALQRHMAPQHVALEEIVRDAASLPISDALSAVNVNRTAGKAGGIADTFWQRFRWAATSKAGFRSTVICWRCDDSTARCTKRRSAKISPPSTTH